MKLTYKQEQLVKEHFTEEKLSSKEKLMIIAKLIIDKCSHEEIDILCVSLLDANLKCRLSK